MEGGKQSNKSSTVRLPAQICTSKMRATDPDRTVIELEASPRFMDSDCQTPRNIGQDSREVIVIKAVTPLPGTPDKEIIVVAQDGQLENKEVVEKQYELFVQESPNPIPT
jgi:hypothetical protein